MADPKPTAAQRRDARARALGFTSYGQQYRASKKGYTGQGYEYNAAMAAERGGGIVKFGSAAGLIISGPAETAAQRKAMTMAILRATGVRR